jgi:hypothetical protein
MMQQKPNGKGVQALSGDDPIEKSLQQEAESCNFVKDLHVGSYLDVKDTTSTWCLATIISLTDNIIHVHYDGWSERFDEVSCLVECRISFLLLCVLLL